jgi:hypothetical protein
LDQDLLRRVGEIRELAAVPALLGVVYAGSGAAGRAAAGAIDRIVGTCEVGDLAPLDVMCRGLGEWRVPPGPGVVALACGFIGTLGVIGSHGSGYVREAVVRALADHRGGAELPFLLIRLNDWVPQVRDAARRAVAERVRPEYVGSLARCLPLIERLRDQGRGDHGAVYDATVALLNGAQGRAELRRAIGAADRQTRRVAFRLLVDAPGDDVPTVLGEALASADTVIRLWAAREARCRLDGDALQEALARMARDRFMPVRREALYGRVERMPASASRYLRETLLDPHASMRDAARFYLGKRGEGDVAEFYRERLAAAAENELATVISGLGETGGVADAAAVARFLDHPMPRVRRAAVRAVGRLDREGHGEQIVAALGDDSPTVAKAARDAVSGRPELRTAGRLWPIFESARRPHVRRIVLELLAELRWWDAAPLLATAAADPADERLRRRAVEFLARRASDPGRLTVRPSREQVEALAGAVARHADVLDPAVREDLEAVLAYARRELG